MKNRSVNILIVALLLLALMSVMILVFLEKAHDDFPKDITVVEDGVTESLLPIRDLKLNPTESKEYSVNLYCAASGSYYIYLDYEETEDGGMKHFVDVTVKANDTVVYEGKLDKLIDDPNEIIQFEGELNAKSKDPFVISITYLMPREIGNEAQGTYSDFDIHLTIKKT